LGWRTANSLNSTVSMAQQRPPIRKTKNLRKASAYRRRSGNRPGLGGSASRSRTVPKRHWPDSC
jgi:hypothetical protein